MLSARHGLRAHYGLLAVHSLLLYSEHWSLEFVVFAQYVLVTFELMRDMNCIRSSALITGLTVDLRLIWGWSEVDLRLEPKKRTKRLECALSIGYWKIVYSKTSIPLWAGALFSSFISLLYRLGTSARRCLFINRGPTFGPRLENDSEHYLAAKYLLILLSKRCLLVEHAVAYGMCGILKRPVTGQSLPTNRLLSSS